MPTIVRTSLRTGLRKAVMQNSEGRESVRPNSFYAGQRRIRNFLALILLAALGACSKPAQPSPEAAQTAETPPTTGLESIPPPDPAKYPPFSNMTDWKNPYLVVREDGIGFVDLSNREIRILKPEEIPAELVALSSSAWPYGRVVLVAQAVPKGPSEQTKADLRKNRALLLGTLKELDVQYREAP
ncbi:MAG: hypothetical protein WB566_06060 [Terriglobales bacterium]